MNLHRPDADTVALKQCAEIPAPTDLSLQMAADMLSADAAEEIVRLCEVIDELRVALESALTCTAIWCMCDAHELLRATEGDNEPTGWT